MMSKRKIKDKYLPRIDSLVGIAGFLISIFLIFKSCSQDKQLEEFNKSDKQPELRIERIGVKDSILNPKISVDYYKYNGNNDSVANMHFPLQYLLSNNSKNSITVKIDGFISKFSFNDDRNFYDEYLNTIKDKKNKLNVGKLLSTNQTELQSSQTLIIEDTLKVPFLDYNPTDQTLLKSIIFVSNQHDFHYYLTSISKLEINLNPIKELEYDFIIRIDTIIYQEIKKLSDEDYEILNDKYFSKFK